MRSHITEYLKNFYLEQTLLQCDCNLEVFDHKWSILIIKSLCLSAIFNRNSYKTTSEIKGMVTSADEENNTFLHKISLFFYAQSLIVQVKANL